MQRLIVTGPLAATFEEVPVPVCPDDGLLIQTSLTAVSTGTEIRVFRAIPVDDEGRFLHETVPFVLPTENGYSMVGRVVEVGTRVTGFAAGDRVFAGTPHKQFATTVATSAIKMPDEVTDEHAVLLNILEVAHIALRRGSPAPGENVAIIGQGVIGLAALAYCRAFGLRTAVVDEDSQRLDIALHMGADLAVSTADENYVEQIVNFFDGEGADLVLEAASHWSAIETAMRVARTNGRIVVVARHTDTPAFNPVGHPFLGKKLTLLTSYGHESPGQRWDRRRSFALTVRLLAEGMLPIEPMITHRFRWNELPEVYRRLHEGERDLVGIVIQWA